MKVAFRKIYDWLNGTKPVPVDEKLVFKLYLDALLVGVLRAENGEWIFAYSDEFRRQDKIKPIVDFPVIEREYRSDTLWPFFALRIPSAKQPVVQEFIKNQPDADEGILLKEFGTRSVANPFRLVAA